MGVLFGLAMDYEVFLVSRMREEFVHTGDPRRAITAGFTASARVVTAAAIIMISVFAAFIPHSDPTVKPIALGLAVGVFVDAFLVRMTLVPAVLALLGHRAWWLPPLAGPTGCRSSTSRASGSTTTSSTRAGPATTARPSSAPRTSPSPASSTRSRWSFTTRRSSWWPRRTRPRARPARCAGRPLDAAGRLVVLDRVLPAEAGAVRRQVGLLPGSRRGDQLRPASPTHASSSSTASTSSPARTRSTPAGRRCAPSSPTAPSSSPAPVMRPAHPMTRPSYPSRRPRLRRQRCEPLQPRARRHADPARDLRRPGAVVDGRPHRERRPRARRRRQPRQAGHHRQRQGQADRRSRPAARRGADLAAATRTPVTGLGADRRRGRAGGPAGRRLLRGHHHPARLLEDASPGCPATTRPRRASRCRPTTPPAPSSARPASRSPTSRPPASGTPSRPTT